MTSNVKNRHSTTKIFFQKVKVIKLNNFLYDSFGFKGIQNGRNWSFLPKTNKRRLFEPKMTSYVQNRHGMTKIFYSKGQAHQSEQFFYDNFGVKSIQNDESWSFFVKKTQKRRLFGPNMTSYVKNRHGTTNFFLNRSSSSI